MLVRDGDTVHMALATEGIVPGFVSAQGTIYRGILMQEGPVTPEGTRSEPVTLTGTRLTPSSLLELEWHSSEESE